MVELMSGVIASWFSVCNRPTISAHTERGPLFLNQNSRLGPVVEKAK